MPIIASGAGRGMVDAVREGVEQESGGHGPPVAPPGSRPHAGVIPIGSQHAGGGSWGAVARTPRVDCRDDGGRYAFCVRAYNYYY